MPAPVRRCERERLDEVVIGTRVEAGDAVVDRVSCGQHQDRQVVTISTQAPSNSETVRSWHPRVEHDGVGTVIDDGAERIESIGRERDVVARQPQRAIE